MNPLKKTLLALSLATISAQASALTTGDIAVIAYNSDGNDNFAWVALVDIPANTVINFTDSSWQGSAFRTTEHLDAGGPLSWSSASMLGAGTVVSYSGATDNAWSLGDVSGVGMAFSTSGDQIFAFLGNASAPTFLFGLNFANSGWIGSGTISNSTNTSNIPAALMAVAGSAVYTDGLDDGYYSGVTTGTKEELLAAIATASNWTTSNSEISSSVWATAMTVTPVPEPETYALMLAGLGLVGAMARRRKA